MYISEIMTSYPITGGLCREVSGVQRTCYKLVRAEVSWSQARTYCQSIARGADLVSIESEIEQIFLVDAILGKASSCSTSSGIVKCQQSQGQDFILKNAFTVHDVR